MSARCLPASRASRERLRRANDHVRAIRLAEANLRARGRDRQRHRAGLRDRSAKRRPPRSTARSGRRGRDDAGPLGLGCRRASGGVSHRAGTDREKVTQDRTPLKWQKKRAGDSEIPNFRCVIHVGSRARRRAHSANNSSNCSTLAPAASACSSRPSSPARMRMYSAPARAWLVRLSSANKSRFRMGMAGACFC